MKCLKYKYYSLLKTIFFLLGREKSSNSLTYQYPGISPDLTLFYVGRQVKKKTILIFIKTQFNYFRNII